MMQAIGTAAFALPTLRPDEARSADLKRDAVAGDCRITTLIERLLVWATRNSR